MIIDANINNTHCIVTKNHFGYDTVINICSGKTQDIPWAFGDWVQTAMLSCAALVVFILVAFLIFLIVRID